MLPAHENCASRASLGLYTFLSGSGRSPILVVGHSFRRCDQSGKYVPPETAGPLPRARGQASAAARRYTVVSGPSLSALRMARRSGERQAGDLPRLASEGFSVALAMEIEAAWKAPGARGAPGTDLQDGAQESDVGRGAHRR